MAMINKENNKMWHIDVDSNDIGQYVILPGDPFRTDLIAKFLDDAKLVAHKREHKTWTGYLDGVKVSVTSTGMGGPSAAIAVEELIAAGAHTFIRVGTAGTCSEESKDESLDGLLCQAAVRDEGTTISYVPLAYPAIADFEVLSALKESVDEKGLNYLMGIIHCKDSFYAELEPETMPNSDYLNSRWKAWEQSSVIGSEMETAALFIVSSVRRVRAGAIMNFKDMDTTIQIACDAIRKLIKKDNQ